MKSLKMERVLLRPLQSLQLGDGWENTMVFDCQQVPAEEQQPILRPIRRTIQNIEEKSTGVDSTPTELVLAGGEAFIDSRTSNRKNDLEGRRMIDHMDLISSRYAPKERKPAALPIRSKVILKIILNILQLKKKILAAT